MYSFARTTRLLYTIGRKGWARATSAIHMGGVTARINYRKLAEGVLTFEYLFGSIN